MFDKAVAIILRLEPGGIVNLTTNHDKGDHRSHVRIRRYCFKLSAAYAGTDCF
jgi:hypothetical protein